MTFKTLYDLTTTCNTLRMKKSKLNEVQDKNDKILNAKVANIDKKGKKNMVALHIL